MNATVDVQPDGTITIRVDGDGSGPTPVAQLHHHPGRGFTVCGGWWQGEPVPTHVLPGIHEVTWREGRSWSEPTYAPDEDAAREWAVAAMTAGQRERASV